MFIDIQYEITNNPNSVSQKDIAALKTFHQHKHEFKLDTGGHEERYEEAKKLTDKYFNNTLYYAYVEEYCAYCTVTILAKNE